MMTENNVYVVARQIYNNENLTVVERASAIAKAFTQMIVNDVVKNDELIAYMERFTPKAFYDDRGRYCTRVNHPNHVEVIVVNYMETMDDGAIGEIQYSGPRGTTRYFEIREDTMPEAFELIAGMDRLSGEEKRFLSNALVQII